ncbi:MAG: hypothetical protein ACO3YY_07780 [Phycisphaerales bacterium]|jgi:hypothetical protein
MSKVVDWIKSNVAIVVCGVVILLVLVLAPWFSSSLEAGVRESAEQRARQVSEIAGFERSPVSLDVPGRAPISGSGVVNAALLEQYRNAAARLQSDAEAVRAVAVEHNRKGRGVVSAEAFPRPPRSQRETIQFDVYDRVVEAYEDLLDRVRAGSPPEEDTVVAELQRREMQFINNTLRKQTRKDLDAREEADLDAELAKARLVRYGERARELSFYASLADLDVPAPPQQSRISTAEMFDWQWRLWVAEDLLEAFAAANDGDASVVEGAVKRVVSLQVLGSLEPPRSGGGGSDFGGGGMPGRRGVEGEGGAAASGGMSDEPPLGEVRIDASIEAPRDFARSFTGRSSNGIYDVRNVEVVLVVATEELPRVFDAIAARNFMTVLDVSLRPADPFEAARRGYIYGTTPVSEVTMLVETVWLREWTAPFMPSDARAALGISSGVVMDQGS